MGGPGPLAAVALNGGVWVRGQKAARHLATSSPLGTREGSWPPAGLRK